MPAMATISVTMFESMSFKMYNFYYFTFMRKMKFCLNIMNPCNNTLTLLMKEYQFLI